MKLYILVKKTVTIPMIVSYILIGCVQNRDEIAPLEAASLFQIAGLGEPGTIGLNLRLNIRAWTRGCETRMGNLGADAFAWKTNSNVGLINGGAIRDNILDLIPKGTKSSIELFKQFITFSNKLRRVRIRAYRLKQAMEGSVSRFNQPASPGPRATETMDEDGPQTGNCFTFESSGSGRFFHISKDLSIEVNPYNIRQTVTGNVSNQNMTISTEGRRIIKLVYKGLVYFNNPTGEINTNTDGQPGQFGWGRKLGSDCTVNNVTFTNSLACEFITVGLVDFQQIGNDQIPSFNPIFPGNNDGSIFLEATDLGDDAESIHEYIITNYTEGPVFPRISGRIIMP